MLSTSLLGHSGKKHNESYAVVGHIKFVTYKAYITKLYIFNFCKTKSTGLFAVHCSVQCMY